MLGWIFKKKGDAPDAATAAATANKVATNKAAANIAGAFTAAVAQAPPPTPAAVPTASVDWAARLAQARGDDAALLALARSARLPLSIKQAAVEALDSEAALRAAELEFRAHDRRVHQIAKRRLLACVAQRQTREQAAQLIESARSLAAEAAPAVNRGVALDRAWQALDSVAIEPEQQQVFAALTDQLAARARLRADTEVKHKRWLSDVLKARQQLHAVCTEAAAGTQDRAALRDAINAAGAANAAHSVMQTSLADAASPGLQSVLADLGRSLQVAAVLDQHLAALDHLWSGGVTAAAPSSDLPALADPQLDALLQDRHARWLQAQEAAQQERQAQQRQHSRQQQRARQGEHEAALAQSVVQAEAALDAGQLADALRQLGAIDAALQGADAPEALRARIAAVQARLAQLRGWQHWAGGRARDELVLQAEALAAATLVEPAPAAPAASTDDADSGDGSTGPGGPTAANAEVARLSLRQRTEVITTLRTRWQEVDRLGGAGNQALWLRFDAALKAAHAPVAAHAAALRQTRQANLAARQQLLETLETVGVPATPAAPSAHDTKQPADPADPAEAGEASSSEATAMAREVSASPRDWATALDRFQLEWRKLGPVEHTVPRASQAALQERVAAAVRRIETPLQTVRGQAQSQRQALVARARALANEGASRGRAGLDELRTLQAQWQQLAKALPLARNVEQALWADFKTAIDTAFAARDAAFHAREAEFEAHASERAELIARLQIRDGDSSAAQRRALVDIEAAWQRCGPAPRARAAALQMAFDSERQALQHWLQHSAQRAWQAQCDALEAKLALCLAQEQAAGAQANAAEEAATADAATDAATDIPTDAVTDLANRWQALPALPAPLEDALRRRAGLVAAPSTANVPPIDELLLQIETAWDLPTPQAFATARRERKLLAMKVALEGRRERGLTDLAPDAALALLLERSGLDSSQRERLSRVLAAWCRRGPPGPS